MRWLQLSDLHFGYDNNIVADMRYKLLDLMKELGPVDYLFLTGDLRYAKNIPGGYPKDLTVFIEKLIHITGLSRERVFMVPGNHDVDRGLVRASVIEKIKAGYKVSDGDIAEAYLRALQDSMKSFAKLYKTVCGRRYRNTHLYTEAEQINIIQLNTALLCGTDQEDGSLIVGMLPLRRALSRMNTDKPAVVLAHHGFDCLKEEEQRALEILLKEKNAVVYLCGHKHKAYCTNIFTMRQNRNLWEYLCGTNMDKSPQIEITDMDFFVGELDASTKEGYVTAYRWSRNCCDWMIDQDFSFSQNGLTDGRHYFSQTLRSIDPVIERQIPAAEKAYKKYLAYECAKLQFCGLPIDNTVSNKSFDLDQLFIPRHFHRLNDYSFDRNIRNYAYYDDLTIVDIIPGDVHTSFRIAVQAELGSGKTTLAKRVALAYALSDNQSSFGDGFPHRELFPVWIRCRTYNFRQSVIGNIRSIPLKEEFPELGSEAAPAFAAIADRHLADGTAVLLVEGLDEIEDRDDRLKLIDQLNIFLEEYKNANIILTSRIAGYTDLNLYLEKYTRYVLNPFTKKDIRDYCRKWYRIVVAQSSKAEKDGSLLADTIIKDTNVCKLAENPLLLTTLLLVHRRLGCLPNKRADLYREAIRVLIETWDEQKGNMPLDFEKTQYQLAYIAYAMVFDGNKKFIKKSSLIELLDAARENRRAWFSIENEAAGTFLERVEQRSTLLLQQGYDYNEAKHEFEEVYEFRHLGFRDYLAAMAVVRKYYPGAKREDRPCDILNSIIENRNLAEVVIFSAVMDPSNPWAEKDVEDIADAITGKIGLKNAISEEYDRMRLVNLLLQIVADEAPLSAEKINRIFELCLSGYINGDQITIFENLLLSKSGPMFEAFCRKIDADKKYGIRTAMISVLKNRSGISSYEYYIANRNSGNPDSVVSAINRIDIALWMGRQWVKEELSDGEINMLYQELTDFAADTRIQVADAALHAVDSLTSLAADIIIPPERSYYLLTRITDVLRARGGSYFIMRLAGKFPIDRTFILRLRQISAEETMRDFILDKYYHENSLFNKTGFFWFSVFQRLWSIRELLEQFDIIRSIAAMDNRNIKELKLRLVDYLSVCVPEDFYSREELGLIREYFDSHKAIFFITDKPILYKEDVVEILRHADEKSPLLEEKTEQLYKLLDEKL